MKLFLKIKWVYHLELHFSYVISQSLTVITAFEALIKLLEFESISEIVVETKSNVAELFKSILILVFA